MPSKPVRTLSDKQLIQLYAIRTARLIRVRGIKLPQPFLREIEQSQREALAECRRRGISDQRLKDAVDRTVMDLQTEETTQREYQVTISACLTVPYAGKESNAELRRRLARQIIDDLTIAVSDPKMLADVLKYEKL